MKRNLKKNKNKNSVSIYIFIDVSLNDSSGDLANKIINEFV